MAPAGAGGKWQALEAPVLAEPHEDWAKVQTGLKKQSPGHRPVRWTLETLEASSPLLGMAVVCPSPTHVKCDPQGG